LIPQDAVVGFGDSTAARQLGVLADLEARGTRILNAFVPKKAGIDSEEFRQWRERIVHDATLCDCFLTGTNALTVDGIDCQENPRESRQRIGYLPENNPLYGQMSVIAFLQFVAAVKGVPRRKIPVKIAEMLHCCRIEDVQDRWIEIGRASCRERV